MDKFNLDSLYRMRHNTSSKEYIIGFFVSVILNRNLFTSNEQVSKFLQLVLHLTLLPYAVRSRTLMCAKASRMLVLADDKQVSDFGAHAAFYIKEFLNSSENEDRLNIKNKKKDSKNALTNMDLWVSGILKKDK
jgi:hypothetical protein